ncbi:vancomycin high temperature exclusion protein [Flammeovirga sp. SJP92]|uniref:SanA/YdcF family protein n=1 Tax=Flammeovirga sp. SJP92 TaxID=1775430 RepID=UPI000789293C|nr:ElyC/SanA/YdcF family protein [Flammeovirga sp. SJP92]KXX70372.1 hypothetical protein AVL50_12260 [Flammeovirga sp. SJP92]
MKKKKILYAVGFMVAATVGMITLLLFWNAYVSQKSAPYILNKENPSITCKTGLMLGTSKFLRSGAPNPFFTNRVNAASELIRGHDVEFIIVSGDNRTTQYNEPKVMRMALEKKGVSKKKIVMDYAGLRTLDSVIRANKVFKQDKYIVISQLFHIERAIFIARHNGIEAYGYPADDVPLNRSYRVHFREIFARAKMFLDLYIFDTQPRFLGKEEVIE